MRQKVAPREGSVDRNFRVNREDMVLHVAPREGSVDRNKFGLLAPVECTSRSPRGERG